MGANIIEVRDQVARLLASMAGPIQLDPSGNLSFDYGSARVFVSVKPFADASSIIEVFSITNFEIDPTPELYKYVALHAGDLIFGHLTLEEEGDKAYLILRHVLLGDFLDPEELFFAVGAVANSADDIDHQLQDQFGGRLANESEQPGQPG